MAESKEPFFPPPPKERGESPFRRPAPRATPLSDEPAKIVVTRPDPPRPEPSAPKKQPAARPVAPLHPSPMSLGIERSGRNPIVALMVRHPRLGGLLMFVLGGASAISGELSRRESGLHWVPRAGVVEMSAALSMVGLWFFLIAIPEDENHTIPDWWKLGLVAFGIIGLAFGANGIGLFL